MKWVLRIVRRVEVEILDDDLAGRGARGGGRRGRGVLVVVLELGHCSLLKGLRVHPNTPAIFAGTGYVKSNFTLHIPSPGLDFTLPNL